MVLKLNFPPCPISLNVQDKSHTNVVCVPFQHIEFILAFVHVLYNNVRPLQWI